MSAVVDAQEPNARYLEALQPPLVRQFELLARAPGGVARLRELILALAVSGKLVPQDLSEEPASVLLQRIGAEKATTAQKLKGRAPAEAQAQREGPSELPRGWTWSTLRDIGLINPRNVADDAIEASFVQMSSIPVGLTESHASEPRPWGDIKSGFTQFADGDVGVAKITPCFENGKSTVFHDLRNGIGAGTTELHIVRPLGGIAPRYILAFLKSPGFLRGGEAVMTGTAGQKRLPRAYFETCPFPLPPLAEQARIVARIDELMRLCDALEAKGRLEAEQHARLLNTLLGTLTDSTTPEELTANWQRVADHFDLLLDRPEAVDALEQTILQLAVRGLLVPQDPNDEPASVLLEQVRSEGDRQAAASGVRFGRSSSSAEDDDTHLNLPASWTGVRLSDICTVITDGEHATPARCADPTQVPLVTAKNVRSESMDYTRTDFVPRQVAEQCWRRCKPEAGDILMVSVGATLGRLCVLREPIEMVLVRSVTLLRPAAGGVDANYLALHLMSPGSQSEIWASVKQSAQPCLYLAKSDALRIALPPHREQLRIVSRVTELRRICAALRQRLAASQATQSHLADALVQSAIA